MDSSASEFEGGVDSGGEAVLLCHWRRSPKGGMRGKIH